MLEGFAFDVAGGGAVDDERADVVVDCEDFVDAGPAFKTGVTAFIAPDRFINRFVFEFFDGEALAL